MSDCKEFIDEEIKSAFCIAVCKGCPPRSTCTSLGTCTMYDVFVKLLYERTYQKQIHNDDNN